MKRSASMATVSELIPYLLEGDTLQSVRRVRFACLLRTRWNGSARVAFDSSKHL
jgi:hypothetical protein